MESSKQYRRQPKLIFSIVGIAFLLLFVVLTVTLYQKNQDLRSQAAELQSLPYEVENATLTNNATVVADATASNGQYVNLAPSGGPVAGDRYFVDCLSGNDTNNGSSEATAWRTISRANNASLQAGDGILLKKGCVFSGQSLIAGWTGTAASNVLVGSYGTGEMPILESNVHGTSIVRITGDYITIDGLHARAIPPSRDAQCLDNPEGFILGFAAEAGAQYNTIQNSRATGAWAGIDLKKGSSFNKVLRNTLVDNNMMSPNDGGGQGVPGGSGDAGAFGVAVHSSNNEIAYNTISGSNACSHDYYWDGGAVEIYGDDGYSASSNVIHHNIASQSDVFSELGKASTGTANDNVFAYNKFTSTLTDSIFLNTRGTGSSYGPIYRTKAYNNSVYLSGTYDAARNKGPQGIVCSGCAPDILTLKNNILWANWKAAYASAPFTESNNIYWKTGGSPLVQGFTMSSTSMAQDPRYVSPSSGDLHLQSGSPANNAGSAESISAGFTIDLGGTTVNNPPEIGGYEL